MIAIPPSLISAWEVFLLFLIPIGGGIPAGVILAQKRAIEWPEMLLLYFFSDVVLAFLFEPIMWTIAWMGKRIPQIARIHEAMKLAMKNMTARYGVKPSPLTLILVSFGVDPMTGRAAAVFAGHGFLMGWTFAIIGDLLFFLVIMISTIWLNGILGDGTWTIVIIVAGMILIPWAFRRLRAWRDSA